MIQQNYFLYPVKFEISQQNRSFRVVSASATLSFCLQSYVCQTDKRVNVLNSLDRIEAFNSSFPTHLFLYS